MQRKISGPALSAARLDSKVDIRALVIEAGVTACGLGAGMSDLLVWYDGGCPLCRREVALMRRLDRRGSIYFVDVALPDAAGPIDRANLLARFHASENGKLFSGAAAFAAMWRAIPLLRPLGLAARHPRVLSVLERAYRRFLRLRPRLQRLAHRFDR